MKQIHFSIEIYGLDGIDEEISAYSVSLTRGMDGPLDGSRLLPS